MHNTKIIFVRTFLLVLAILVFTSQLVFATIRYVSTTGSSTPPYTSWETAADSIQKCIDFSSEGDTIIVANGTYYESLIVDKYLWLIGSSMDSTVIDGTGLNNYTIETLSNFNIEGFKIIGKGRSGGLSHIIIFNLDFNVNVKQCRMHSADQVLGYGNTSGSTDQVIISDCRRAVFIFCANDTCKPIISNSVIIMDGGSGFTTGIRIFDGGNPVITDNIILDISTSSNGIGMEFGVNSIIIRNNIVAGFGGYNILAFTSDGDTAFVENNVVRDQTSSESGSIYAGSKTTVRNNIVGYNSVGLRKITGSDAEFNYNLFWQNEENTAGGIVLDSTDVIADPMFVKDTIPVYGGSYDYHLQANSPAIDAGDPNILDVDGSRSDIGVFGGPGGESYLYLDFAPRAPVNISAEVDSSEIALTWNRNTEADFSYYRIYRDTVKGFTIDSTKLISSQTDTFYIQLIPSGTTRLVYKLTAVDSQGNVSVPSEEVIINITSVEEYPFIVSDYQLYQNYPNPFNPSTKIGYRLKERGYVKLMVYDIKGELVDILVNEVKDAGYHETELSSEVGRGRLAVGKSIASGIYLYRIEIIGEGNIPVYSDMKKMILLK